MKARPTHSRILRPLALVAPALAVAGATALAAASAVQAQAPAQTGPESRGRDPIVVQAVPQAQMLSRAAAEARAAGFIRSAGVASGEVPTARWVDPICPSVTGLIGMAQGVAEARIRRVAEAAGVPVAAEPCAHNIVVSFTESGAGLARAISQRDGRRLAELSPSARDAMLTGAAPIRWMYNTEVRSGDGRSAAIVAGGNAHGGLNTGEGAGNPMPGPGGLMLYNSSVVSTLTQRVIVSAIVIVDQNQVMGRRLSALADYAALVALAEIRSAGATPEGSILNMFAAPDGPTSLTAQDAAFLRALYRLPLDRQAVQHRGALVAQMTNSMAGANP